MKKIISRAKAPTPKFFKLLRTVGFVCVGIGSSIIAAPVVLPVLLTTIGGYIAVAGGVLSAVSQLTKTDDAGAK